MVLSNVYHPVHHTLNRYFHFPDRKAPWARGSSGIPILEKNETNRDTHPCVQQQKLRKEKSGNEITDNN